MAADDINSGGKATEAPVRDGDTPAFELTDLLSHLLRRAHFDAEAAFAEHYSSIDITSRQLALIYTIAAHPGAQQAEIAEVVGLDVNTCSDLAKRIERKGLIRRERSTLDRRAFGLYLTDAGREMMRVTRPITPPYQRAIAARLSNAERQTLETLLRRLLGLEPPR